MTFFRRTLPRFLVKAGFALGPGLTFLPQLYKTQNPTSGANFSRGTVLLIIFSHLLRVFFWLGKRFDVVLLYQSIIMIWVQLMLLQAIVTMRQRPQKKTDEQGSSPLHGANNNTDYLPASSPTNNPHGANLHHHHQASVTHIMTTTTSSSVATTSTSLTEDPWHYYVLDAWRALSVQFWLWDDFANYIVFLLSFSIFISLVLLGSGLAPAVVQGLGTCSAACEAFLAMPLLWRNYQAKDTRGISLPMVMSWALGDMGKVLYYYVCDSPTQLLCAGCLQLATDLGVLCQMVWIYPTGGEWASLVKALTAAVNTRPRASTSGPPLSLTPNPLKRKNSSDVPSHGRPPSPWP